MHRAAPPDQAQRNRALDPTNSVMVEASAGSGKTDLLVRRFLRLLAEVDEPGQVVAITFTIPAAAEMRQRILTELEKAAMAPDTSGELDEFSMATLARRALNRSEVRGWKLVDLPAQLRISTIDSFCRDLALQEPLLSGLGGGLAIAEQPEDLYLRAARQTLERIGQTDPALNEAIESLLVWRDNNWQELEEQLVEMLKSRDRWMRDFVLDRDPDWDELRSRLERPFANAVVECLVTVDRLLDQAPKAREEILLLSRFACGQTGGTRHGKLAELAEFPGGPLSIDTLEETRRSYLCVANFLLTGGRTFRKQVDKRLGFPANRKSEKTQILDLIERLRDLPGLEEALAEICGLPPARYTEEDWNIIRACFTLLRHAAGQLRVVFAETGTLDFIEVSQIAQRVLQGADGLPTDSAIAVADGVRHLLVDEFQDTSRRQHKLLASLIAAWPERTGRTCFFVGDPKQSIYFFRDADAELFPRVQLVGLEIPDGFPLRFEPVALRANFRTEPQLIERLNEVFTAVFAVLDGSGVSFSPAAAARAIDPNKAEAFKLHLKFSPQTRPEETFKREQAEERESVRNQQLQEIVALIKRSLEKAAAVRARGEGGRYRIAVLARARSSLAPIVEALHEAGIPFRALDLERLSNRPEILDVLGLARALLNPEDRVAWLGLLRAPWCGLTLDDLHRLTSADDAELLRRPIPELLGERLPLLNEDGQRAVRRVVDAISHVPEIRANLPIASLGTKLEQVWLRLGGDLCVDATARANLELLWGCLDHLPAGEQDVLGPALNAALEKLTARPDPSADSDFGVQLMTIHKAKGLEFEVVIVPDLQARCGQSSRKMLSWLERGIPSPDDSGEVTEFLVAPIQTKGGERGKAKKWVDGVYRHRELQEDRRILYVAATRARESLHLFARPSYKSEAGGGFSLCEPASSLLATAWPAFEDAVRAGFEKWKATRDAGPADVESIAASADGGLFIMPSPAKPTLLRRLPPGFRTDISSAKVSSGESKRAQTSSSNDVTVLPASPSRFYARHEGGLLSRAFGTAVHAFMEELARLREDHDWDAARSALQRFEPRVAALARAAGIAPLKASSIAAEALRQALDASNEAMGQWVLSPHTEAVSERRWTGLMNGELRTVQVDRVFRAGLEPRSEGQEAWWIVDYKTAHTDNPVPADSLPRLHVLFAQQIEAYAKILRNLHGQDAVLRAGLYYPRMQLLDWWKIEC